MLLTPLCACSVSTPGRIARDWHVAFEAAVAASDKSLPLNRPYSSCTGFSLPKNVVVIRRLKHRKQAKVFLARQCAQTFAEKRHRGGRKSEDLTPSHDPPLPSAAPSHLHRGRAAGRRALHRCLEKGQQCTRASMLPCSSFPSPQIVGKRGCRKSQNGLSESLSSPKRGSRF